MSLSDYNRDNEIVRFWRNGETIAYISYVFNLPLKTVKKIIDDYQWGT